MAETASLHAGAGRARIVLPAEIFPVDGFAAERDPLYARVVLLQHRGHRIALAVLDQTSIAAASLAGVTRTLAHAAEVEPDQVLVCASHTFSAPHIGSTGDVLQRALEDAVEAAGRTAHRGLRPARLGWGTGTAGVNVNRDVWTPAGWWLGADDAGASDKELGILRIDDEPGHPIAVLLNYAVQPSVLNESVTADGWRLVSADLAGAATAYVERAYGDDTVALFLVGAAGDQAPYLTANRHVLDRGGAVHRADLHEAGHVLVDLLGERLGCGALRVCEQVKCADDGPILRLVRDEVEVGAQPLPPRESLHPQRTYDYRASGTTTAPLWAARVGDLALAAVQAELTCTTGRWIKDNSPFPATFVLTMANGAAKYLADAGSYERITYAAMNSRYAAGAAELVAARLVETLRALR